MDAELIPGLAFFDAGDESALRSWLKQHPASALLPFIAENPIRRGTLPGNILSLARTILENSTDQIDLTLANVSSGRIPRECGVQLPLIDLLCEFGANPNYAMRPALVHGEFAAVHQLIKNGAVVDLPVAAATGRIAEATNLLASASAEDRHAALALSAQFGHIEIVRLLLDAGEDPSRYNPPGTHAHSTPLHQAAVAGHLNVVHLLVERGARLDLEDTVYHGTPAGWAEYGGQVEVEKYLNRKKM
jgi:ankyrin repeat protein